MNTLRATNQTVQVPINFQGVLNVSADLDISDENREEIVLELLRKSFAKTLACQNSCVKATLANGEFFSSSGPVSVGDMNFTVTHNPQKCSSEASFMLTPAKGTTGHGEYAVQLGVTISPHTVCLTDHSRNKLITRFKVEGGRLEQELSKDKNITYPSVGTKLQ